MGFFTCIRLSPASKDGVILGINMLVFGGVATFGGCKMFPFHLDALVPSSRSSPLLPRGFGRKWRVWETGGRAIFFGRGPLKIGGRETWDLQILGG